MSQAQRAVHAEELARAGADRAAATAEAQLDAVKENHDAERKGLQVWSVCTCASLWQHPTYIRPILINLRTLLRERSSS